MKNKHLTNLFIKHRDFFDMQKTEEKKQIRCMSCAERRKIYIHFDYAKFTFRYKR